MVVFSLHSMSPGDVQALQVHIFHHSKTLLWLSASKSVSCQLIAVVINIAKWGIIWKPSGLCCVCLHAGVTIYSTRMSTNPSDRRLLWCHPVKGCSLCEQLQMQQNKQSPPACVIPGFGNKGIIWIIKYMTQTRGLSESWPLLSWKKLTYLVTLTLPLTSTYSVCRGKGKALGLDFPLLMVTQVAVEEGSGLKAPLFHG